MKGIFWYNKNTSREQSKTLKTREQTETKKKNIQNFEGVYVSCLGVKKRSLFSYCMQSLKENKKH